MALGVEEDGDLADRLLSSYNVRLGVSKLMLSMFWRRFCMDATLRTMSACEGVCSAPGVIAVMR